MLTANLSDLTLLTGWFEDDPAYRTHVAFPFYKSTGTANSAVVYFEIAPGEALREHTDSHEEILLVLEGTLEATVGTEQARLEAGALAVIPQMVPHGLRNVGATKARAIGFFPGSTVESTFPVPIQPVGQRNGGAPPIPTDTPLTWNQIAAMLTGQGNG